MQSTQRSRPSGTPSIPPPDLIVFSHLRWSWVWQRPQHLISRLAASRRTWFVEEPLADPHVQSPEMRWEQAGPVVVGRLHVPGPERHIGFDSPEGAHLGLEVEAATTALLASADDVPVVWLYTPLALELAERIPYRTMVFDVMDDLASFKDASPRLRSCHVAALTGADVVFTGGRSLHDGVARHRTRETYLFPSGVETEHYAGAVQRRACASLPPTAGYVGVIDERLDLDLLAGLAARLPGWRIEVVGPVAKIDPATLPQGPNLHYPGAVSYGHLPDVMARFDVALMPFALNEATRSISPTKTLEYLAAGLPITSTRVPDVVTDYGHVVRFADDAEGFAAACTAALGEANDTRYHARCRPLLDWHHWDRVAGRMDRILRDAAGAADLAAMERTA